MAIIWTKLIPRWGGTTIEPPEAKKDEGYLIDDVPPASWENWLRKGTYEALDETRDVIEDIDAQLAQMGNNDKEARNAINNLKFELEEKGLVDFINNNTGIGYYDNFKDNNGIDLLNTTASVDNVNKIVNFDTGETLKFKQQSFFGASKIEIKIKTNLVDYVQVADIISDDTLNLLAAPGSLVAGDKIFYNGEEYIVTSISVL